MNTGLRLAVSEGSGRRSHLPFLAAAAVFFGAASTMRKPSPKIDWPAIFITGWIVVTAAMLTGAVLAAHLNR